MDIPKLVDGSRPLSKTFGLIPDEVAGLMASVATTLADLHERGVVHGDLDASHVLLRPDGPPVLTGPTGDGEPADDVAALGRLVITLLAGTPALPLRPTRNGWRRPFGRRRRLPLGPMLAPGAGGVLAGLGELATAANPQDRPTARALARAIQQRLPSARLPGPPDRTLLPRASTGRGRSARQRRVRPALAAGCGLLAAVMFLFLLIISRNVWGGSGKPTVERLARDGPTARPTSLPTTAPTASTSIPTAVRVWPADPLDFHEGVLVFEGIRYSIGAPGDALVTGDFLCSGTRTLALLRPGTGEVFTFDVWPGADTDTTGRPAGTVPGATTFRAVKANDRACDELEVARTKGSPVRVRVTASK